MGTASLRLPQGFGRWADMCSALWGHRGTVWGSAGQAGGSCSLFAGEAQPSARAWGTPQLLSLPIVPTNKHSYPLLHEALDCEEGSGPGWTRRSSLPRGIIFLPALCGFPPICGNDRERRMIAAGRVHHWGVALLSKLSSERGNYGRTVKFSALHRARSQSPQRTSSTGAVTIELFPMRLLVSPLN